MAERWQQWMPRDIDSWQGSANIQALSDLAYRAVDNLLMDMWKQADCALPVDDRELAKRSRVAQRWSECREEVLEYFCDRTETGRLTHRVLLKRWVEAREVYEKRQAAAKKTNASRTGDGHRNGHRDAQPTVTERSPSRSADTGTSTGTSTGTKVHVLSVPTEPHPDESGIVKKHPDLQIYEIYPRKEGRGNAMQAIAKAVKRMQKGESGEDPMDPLRARRFLYARVLAYARSPAGMNPDLAKIPHPATWFNQSRYLDDQAAWQQTGATNGNFAGKTESSLNAAQRAIDSLAARARALDEDSPDHTAAFETRSAETGEAGRPGLLGAG